MTFDCKENVLVAVEDVFRERIPFNRVLGLDISMLGATGVEVRFNMKPELVGNFTRGILHGGVVCSVLDVVGGLAVLADVARRHEDSTEADFIKRFTNLGTVDIRIDFLRPGRGSSFVATADVLRTGARIGVVRMDLINDEGDQIAAGTGSYRIA